MSKRRPVYISLTEFRFPITALVSITHRITGILLGLFFPFVLYVWFLSLESEIGFEKAVELFSLFPVQVFLFVTLSSFWFHVVAGIRHLLMDFHFGLSKQSSKIASICVFFFSFVGFLFIGLFIW